MIVYSDKLNCYIEGIRIPISSAYITNSNNSYAMAEIKIGLGENIVPHLWSNALIQVSHISENKEKLFFQGLIIGMELVESDSYIDLQAISSWSVFNLNTTLDYVAPKKYGIQDLENEIKIYLGNEEVISTDNGDIGDNYHMSHRYFFLSEENQDIGRDILKDDDPDNYKLQYIGDRTPFASLFAFTILEQMSYKNFMLSEAHIDRLNLLRKVQIGSKRSLIFEKLIDESLELTEISIDLDSTRYGLKYEKAKFVTSTGTQGLNELSLGDVGGNLPYKGIAAGAKIALERASTTQNNIKGIVDMHGFVPIDQILNAYDTYCKSANIDPNLMIAQAQHESGFNPRAVSPTGYKGWGQFGEAAWSESSSKPSSERFSILESISAQIRYMHRMFTYGKGDYKKALSNYVDGPNASNRPQTPAYISSITGIYNSYFNK